MKQLDKRQVVGWTAVCLSTAITCFWALWGTIETFHEGWYYESWMSNVGLMFVQYLSPMLIFMAATLVSILWPRFSGGLHAIPALLAAWFFEAVANPGMFILILPLVGIGVLYWFGHPQPRKQVCQHLREDGLTLASTPQHIWRMPTVDEAVRSMARHGQNSSGVWDAETAKATYKTRPDKESPLWNVHSQVIYWWTATEVDEKRAIV